MLYEWRTYHAAAGKMDALHRRFAEHTCRLFDRHGIRQVGYFVPVAAEGPLHYLLAYPDQVARDTAWTAFRADPQWQAAKADSEREGPLVERIDSVFLQATPYSPQP